MSTRIILHDKVLKSISRRHPWVFSGAIKTIKGTPEDGDILRLVAGDGTFAGRGYWNSHSQIRVRILSWNEDEVIDQDFWEGRLRRALDSREPGSGNARRLVHAENDYLPGLVVDQYADWLVIQALTLGINRRKHMLAELLAEMLQPTGIYERSDVEVRAREGLVPETGVLWGAEPPDVVEIEENGQRFLVDIKAGQKTGFYLDQRENRAALHAMLKQHPGTEDYIVLNAFGYTGGFAVAALAAGVQRVISLDSSASALALAERNIALNGQSADPEDFMVGNAGDILRGFREQGRVFDCIILDPPKFAQTSRQVERATRGYKDINLLAFQLLRAGGWLWTFSCSNAVDADLFQKVVFGALVDAGREGQILRHLSAPPDHPVALTFPEGSYLKGLVCRVW
ncbi:MAG: class I SAM-dependent rRNA methyltransferase [Chloroflexi bacterium]|nr:class I SAM-dependent rRNA methyltransferase [Chloroflexota bacterium]